MRTPLENLKLILSQADAKATDKPVLGGSAQIQTDKFISRRDLIRIIAEIRAEDFLEVELNDVLKKISQVE